MRKMWLVAIAVLAAVAAVPAMLALAEDDDEGGVTAAATLGPAFTYQGRLSDDGQAADGSYDFEFRLYDAADGDTQIGGMVAFNDLQVANGLFTVALNFGAGAFTGDERFLDVRVRPGSSIAGFQILAPRQLLMATPYAISLVPGAVVEEGGLGLTLAGTGAALLAEQTADDGAAPAIYGRTGSTEFSAFGVIGEVSSTAPGEFSTGVRGRNLGEGPLGVGVWGSQEGSGWGVYGETPSGIGVFGIGLGPDQVNTGVVGQSNSTAGVGVRADGAGGIGIALEVKDGGLKVSGTSPAAFVHSPVVKCAALSATPLENPHLNNNPNAIVIITANTSDVLPPAGGTAETYQVAYNVDNTEPGFAAAGDCPEARWVIYTITGDAIPAGLLFNVLVINR